MDWKPIDSFPFPELAEGKFSAESEAVLIWEGKDCAVAHCTRYRDGSISWWVHDSYGFNEDGQIYDVTHWMPLPAPPKVKD